MSPLWSKILRFALIALLPLALIVLGLTFLGSILFPFLVGMAAAYLLDPVADRLERMRFSRITATGIITVSFFLVLVLIVLILLPPLASQASQLAVELPGYLEGMRDRMLPALTQLIERFSLATDLAADGVLKEQFGKAINVFVSWIGGLLQSGVALLNLVALMFITPIVTFYMLRDWDRMIAVIRKLVPPDHLATFDHLGEKIDEVLAGFIRGQGLVCSFLALFYGLGLWMVDLRYGLIIGLLTGLVSFVPFIGMALGMVVGLSVAAFQFQDFWMVAVVAGIFGLGQFIEGNLISPRLVGSRIHLHPVWVIFAVLAGTTLFGIIGTLLAVPFAAVLGVLIRFWVGRYQDSALYHQSGRDDTPVAVLDADGNVAAVPERHKAGSTGRSTG
ncbi:MAG: AI-2E family transporter [Alphaproteobacteria bacterium]|nr:AI-2E family transporter [Alphaproteobacteria bacterium]